MVKPKTKTPLWLILTQGGLLTLALYFLGILGLSLLLVNECLGEGGAFPAILVLGGVVSLFGSMISARRCSGVNPMLAGLAVGSCAALSLAAAGFGCWEGIALLGRGGILFLTICGCGGLGGYLAGKHRKKGKRVRR